MNEQERGAAARRYRNRAEAEQLVAEYEASGLGRREFCSARGVRLSTFNRYLKRRREGPAQSAGVNLIAVDLCGAAPAGKGENSGLAVALAGGRRIEVGREFDARTLVQLLSLLERF